MEIEELFLVSGCLALFFDLVQLSKAKPRQKTKLERAFYASVLVYVLITASYLMLVRAFLDDDFSLIEVYSYSSSSLPLTSKFYATWAGASSSMLFLTFLLATLYLAYRLGTREMRGAFNIASYRILNFILLFFIVVTLANSPFGRFPEARIEGRGLNPLLQTFWMIVHPPVVFAGYVFVIFSLVLALAGLSTKENSDDRLLRLSLQTAWLATTLGIAIGGLWAYEVLGWGGYWAWDPVETASLLPWLALTAYFHVVPLSKKGQSLVREFMILIAFEAVIFTAALTRGGLLVSVHAYAGSPIGSVFLALAVGMAFFFFYLRGKTKKPLCSFDLQRLSLRSLSFFTGYCSLILIFLVCFWGLAFPIITGIFMPNPMTISSAFYSNWSFPFAMAFVAALIGCSLHDQLDFRKYAMLVAGALSVGVVSVQVGLPTPNMLANLGFPLLIVAFSAALYRLVRVLPVKKRSLRLFGRSLLHLAIVVILMGVFLSSTSKRVADFPNAKPNTTIEAFGLRMQLANFSVYNGTGNVHSTQVGVCVPEYSALKMDVAVEWGGSVYRGALWVHLYTLHGVVSTPLIITTWSGDIYLHMHHTESMYDSLVQALLGKEVPPQNLMVTVETIPMVHSVWVGATLMSIGLVVPLVRELLRLIPKKASRG